MQNECATSASIQGDGQGLVLKGRYKDKQVCSLLSRYVGSFVKCPACGSSHATTLERDPRRRIDLLRCVACDASTAVANVRDSGFQAAGRTLYSSKTLTQMFPGSSFQASGRTLASSKKSSAPKVYRSKSRSR